MKKEQLKQELERFADIYGIPSNIKEPEQMTRLIDCYFEDISEYIKTDEDWQAAVKRVRANAFRFPAIPHFLSDEHRNSTKSNPEPMTWQEEEALKWEREHRGDK